MAHPCRLPPLPSYPWLPHQSTWARTHSHKNTPISLGSIPQPPHQARADSYYSVRFNAYFYSYLFPYLLAGEVCNNLLTGDVASLPCWPECILWTFSRMHSSFSHNKLHSTAVHLIHFTSCQAGLALCLPSRSNMFLDHVNKISAHYKEMISFLIWAEKTPFRIKYLSIKLTGCIINRNKFKD